MVANKKDLELTFKNKLVYTFKYFKCKFSNYCDNNLKWN